MTQFLFPPPHTASSAFSNAVVMIREILAAQCVDEANPDWKDYHKAFEIQNYSILNGTEVDEGTARKSLAFNLSTIAIKCLLEAIPEAEQLRETGDSPPFFHELMDPIVQTRDRLFSRWSTEYNIGSDAPLETHRSFNSLKDRVMVPIMWAFHDILHLQRRSTPFTISMELLEELTTVSLVASTAVEKNVDSIGAINYTLLSLNPIESIPAIFLIHQDTIGNVWSELQINRANNIVKKINSHLIRQREMKSNPDHYDIKTLRNQIKTGREKNVNLIGGEDNLIFLALAARSDELIRDVLNKIISGEELSPSIIQSFTGYTKHNISKSIQKNNRD